MMTAIKSIQVTDDSELKVAKALKKIVEKLFAQEVVICFEDGDLVLQRADLVEGLIVFDNQIKVTAATLANLLAVGTQTIIRLYLKKLPLGKTSVIFKQEQRILMIDLARKYFSKEVIFQFIDSMSLAQFNYLQLHFSENEGFRIESEIASDSVSKNHLTKNEIREIIQYADLAGIEIIPDFDTPGHVKKLIENQPEWQLQKKKSDGQLEREATALNICNPEAVFFIEKLYKEYAELFKSSRYFHIGGDEFVDFDEIDAYPELKEAAVKLYGKQATAMDYFVHYINQVADKLSSWGFVPRVWNDGFFRLNRREIVKLSKKVEITYWTKWHQNMATVKTVEEQGYRIINFNDNYFYYVLGENAGYTYPTYEKIISEWKPTMYPQAQTIDSLTNQYSGVAIAIWSDHPDAQSERVVLDNVGPLLLAVSQKESAVFMTEEEAVQLMQTYYK